MGYDFFPKRHPGQLCFTVYKNAEVDKELVTNIRRNFFCVNQDGTITGQTIFTLWEGKSNETIVS